MARGYLAAQKIHEDNTGLGYTPFKIKDKQTEQVRIIQPESEWLTIFIHKDYPKLKTTRCAATIRIENDQEIEDRSTCPLCMAEVTRSPRTFIPVRVRGDVEESRVQVIEYGRDGFQQVINQIENLPEGKNMTDFDFKITRRGDKLDTTYFWNISPDVKTHRPLIEAETSLTIPNMEDIIPILEESVLLRRAQAYADSANVTPVPSSNGHANGNGSAKTPF